MPDLAPMGNCCNGGRMEKYLQEMGGNAAPAGVEVLSPAFRFAKENGVAPLGNCCSGGSMEVPADNAGLA
jgi:hypothetical protein